MTQTNTSLIGHGEWEVHGVSWSESDRAYRFPAGAAIVFHAWVPKAAEAARVGFVVALRWGGEFETEAWSEPFEVDATQATQAPNAVE